MYRSLANFANVTSDIVQVFLRLYSFTDFNQRRLVKNKMATIFKPALRRALTSYATDSSQGIFGGVKQVTKTLEDTMKSITLIKQSLLQTKKTGKAGTKSGKNKGKKPAAGESKAKARILARRRPEPLRPKPRLTLVTPRRKRTAPRRRKNMTNLSQ